MPKPVAALADNDLPEGETRVVRIGDVEILLCRDEGRVYAIENRCSHLDEPLTCGKVRWGRIACPAHGARFDLESGVPINPPATLPIKTYAVRVVDGMIELAL